MEKISLKNYPTSASAVRETKKFFESSQKAPEADGSIIVDEGERTPDGMIELGWDHLTLQRDLHQEFTYHTRDYSRQQLEQLAAARMTEINAGRQDKIDIHNVDERFLRSLAEPVWAQASEQQLDELNLSEEAREYASELKIVEAKLAVLSADEKLRQVAREQFGERTHVVKAAFGVIRANKRRDVLAQEISQVYERAGAKNRGLNRADKARIARLEVRLQAIDETKITAQLKDGELDDFQREFNRFARRQNHQELNEGLLLTEEARDHIEKVLPSLVAGRPALFVGETGGAKTALAKTLARKFMGKEPEFVSMHSDVTVYQLIGKDRLEHEKTVFADGPIARAMAQGRPVILDEINSVPPEVLKRLNEITQLRPGDKFTIQEDSGKQITVQPGFCVIATANEKSMRYKGVDVMSAEFKNRFGMNIRRVQYPDQEVVFGQLPPDNMALAEAALSDEIGEFALQLPPGQLEAFVRAAHASQKIFTGNYGEGSGAGTLRAFVPGDRLTDNKPGLEDTVLSPRLMVATIEQVKDGMGRISLVDVLKDWVNGIEKPADRAIMIQLLDSHLDETGTSLLGNKYQDQNKDE